MVAVIVLLRLRLHSTQSGNLQDCTVLDVFSNCGVEKSIGHAPVHQAFGHLNVKTWGFRGTALLFLGRVKVYQSLISQSTSRIPGKDFGAFSWT